MSKEKQIKFAVALFIFCLPSVALCQNLRWLVDEKALAGTELEVVWQSEFPFGGAEQLEQLKIIGNKIFGISSINHLVSLNRHNGNAVFIKDFTPIGLPILSIDSYGEQLFGVVGNRLVELEPQTAAEISNKRLDFTVVSPAVRNKNHYYIAGSDSRVHALRTLDKVQLFEVAPDSDSPLTSVICNEDIVIFGAQAGDVACIVSNTSKKKWKFNAADAIAAPIVQKQQSVYFSSMDTNIYKLDVLNGKLLWKYQTDGLLDQGPVVSESVVYQYVKGSGLVAIDIESGQFMWKSPEAIGLLAENANRAYLLAKTGGIIVMDNEKKEKVCTINLGNVTKYAVNIVDSKIYIADSKGRIACLQPNR